MKRRLESLIACLLAVSINVGSPSVALAQTAGPPPTGAPATAPAPPSTDEPWPRTTTHLGATISIFQPQLESWTGNTIAARAAVRIKSANSTDYGVIWLSARTEVDKVNRMVTLLDVKITKQNFPTLSNNGAGYTTALLNDLPPSKTVALDLLEADLAVTNAAAQQKTYELQNDPPKIIYSMSPAVLVLLDGQPVLQPSADKFQKVVNTRALLIYDPKKYSYYLGSWTAGWSRRPSRGRGRAPNIRQRRTSTRSSRERSRAIRTSRWGIRSSRSRTRTKTASCRRYMWLISPPNCW